MTSPPRNPISATPPEDVALPERSGNSSCRPLPYGRPGGTLAKVSGAGAGGVGGRMMGASSRGRSEGGGGAAARAPLEPPGMGRRRRSKPAG